VIPKGASALKRTYVLLCGSVCLAVLCSWTPMSLAQEGAGDELVPLVLNLLNEKDKDMRALGLEQVRTEAKGPAATRQFAAQLPKLPPDVQAALLRALADRGDSAARPAVVDLLAASQDAEVRLAAIGALGFLGEPADSPLLLRLLTEGSPAEQASARTALTRMPGESVATAVAAEMQRAGAAQRVTLIGILAARRAFDTAADILPAAVDADASVRTAAMAALGELAGPEHIPGMVRGVLAAEMGREREAAEKAVMFVCSRISDVGQQAAPLLAAMETLNEADRTAVLPALGRVGGPAALKIVRAAIADSDPRLHEAGVRALCNWPDASIAPALIERVQTDAHPSDRTAALRALIRVAPLPDGRSDAEKLELLQKALALCTRDSERNLTLQRAAAIRTIQTLRFLTPYLDQPAYAQQACQAVVELAHHRDLREPNKAEFDRTLDKVIQTSTDATVIDRANRYKKGQTWARPTAPE
jgi:HEAT repeat protein